MTAKVDDRPSETYVKCTIEDMKRLRFWFAGFQAAGGKLPVNIENLDCLRKAQILLEKVETKNDRNSTS